MPHSSPGLLLCQSPSTPTLQALPDPRAPEGGERPSQHGASQGHPPGTGGHTWGLGSPEEGTVGLGPGLWWEREMEREEGKEEINHRHTPSSAN